MKNSMRMNLIHTVLITAGLLAVMPAQAAVWYVDVDSEYETPDGTEWAKAFRTIQDGVDAAYSDSGGEVWVAEGTYTATTTNVVVMGNGVAVFDDDGYVALKGVAVPGSGDLAPTPSKELLIHAGGNAKARLDGSTGNLYLEGTVTENVAPPDPGPNGVLVIKDKQDSLDSTVSFIDSGGNLVLKKRLLNSL